MRREGVMRKRILLTICAILLVACASSKSVLLTEDTALVSAFGRSPGDKGKIIDATLHEAAKLTQAHGYRYFVILTAAGTSTMPRTRVSASSRYQSRPDLYSSAYRRPTSAFDIGSAPRKPGLEITIRMYRLGEVDPDSQGVWNSDVILGVMAASR